MNRMRGYHSTAVLLPDGSVFVGGDQGEGADASETTVEVYRPWYFAAPSRPALTSAPAQAGYGAEITLGTSAAGLSKVVLVRASSTTHAMNTDQRLIELPFRTAAGSVIATTPASPNLAPPGPYLVFLVDGQNVPSTGRFVSLSGTAPPPPPPNQPPTVALTAPAGGATFTAPASITLTATASDSDGSVTQVEFLSNGAPLGTDTGAPYSYTWNNVPAGTYTLIARATDDDGASTDSAPVQITVTAPPTTPPPPGPAQAVTGFTLIDADLDQPVAGFDPLVDGAVLNLATLPTRNLNIRANTSPSPVGSVRFGLDGNASYRIESGVPYALAGDTAGDYAPWTPALGAHSLTATPYDQAAGTGTAGTPFSIAFTVVDDPGPPPAPPGTGGGGPSQTHEGRNGDAWINDRCPLGSVAGPGAGWIALLALGSLLFATRRRA